MTTNATPPVPRIAEIRAELDAIAPMREDGPITAAELARYFAVRAQERFVRALLPGSDYDLDPARVAAAVAEFVAARALAGWHQGDVSAIRDAISGDGDLMGEWLADFLGSATARRVADLAEQLQEAWTATKQAEPEPPLPDGEYARVEILGHDSHAGWVTEATRAGQPVMVVRDWDGRTIAEVPGHSLYRFVPLATPLKRPEPRAAITAGAGDGDPWGSDDDDYDDERHPF